MYLIFDVTRYLFKNPENLKFLDTQTKQSAINRTHITQYGTSIGTIYSLTIFETLSNKRVIVMYSILKMGEINPSRALYKI